MSVPPYDFASAASLIFAQRLTQGLCGRCKTVQDVPQEVLLKAGIKEPELTGIKISKPVGCDQCKNGYKDGSDIYLLMPISEAMGSIILEGGQCYAACRTSVPGRHRQPARVEPKKVKEGITILEKINRVTKN